MSEQSAANKFSLTEGGIIQKLLLVALPIMGTQLIQMVYNLTDMFFLGRIDADAVAASGIVGMYMWLSMSFMMFGRMGAEIGVSQSLGRGERERAQTYAQTALAVAAALGLLFGLAMIVGRGAWIGFFNIQEAHVAADAETYLAIVGIGMPFLFVSSAITGVFNGSGNARAPFYINGLGLVLNIALDPLLIFGLRLGIRGAAIATITAQIVACGVALWALRCYRNRPFAGLRLFVKPEGVHLRRICQWATPVATESFFFTFLSMLITALVSPYGADALAAQRVSGQVESLSWLIAGGFSSALTAFVGQNYGAGKWTRVHQGYNISCRLMAGWGLLMSVFLYLGARLLIQVFIPNEPEVIALGVINLRILAYCQLAFSLEGVAVGAFRGLGRTTPPAVASISINVLRVVAAYLVALSPLAGTPAGLYGLWWCISIGGFVRGAWIFLWYWRQSRKMPKEDLQLGGFTGELI